MNNQPNYKAIYKDIITKQFPEKSEILNVFLAKDSVSSIDVLKINCILFGNSSNKFKSYKERDIKKILKKQKDNKWTNTETAKYFNLSRNTITVWKNKFIIK